MNFDNLQLSVFLSLVIVIVCILLIITIIDKKKLEVENTDLKVRLREACNSSSMANVRSERLERALKEYQQWQMIAEKVDPEIDKKIEDFTEEKNEAGEIQEALLALQLYGYIREEK